MANQLITTYAVVNSVNVSAYLQDFSAPETTAMEDATVMTSTAKINRPGLNDSSITMSLVQDYGAGGPDATFSALKGNVGFTMEWRPTSASASPTNPKRTGTYVLESYDPMSGKAGNLNLCKVTLKPASDVTRATS
jgi:hypothetical protein